MKSIFTYFACQICLISLLAIATSPSMDAATTYYVDYDSGNDTNNGTAAATPWKHCTGDTNATGFAASTVLQPGDTILFKGGVHYRGSIRATVSGTSGNPITYKGDAWGTPKAIIDGSVPFTKPWTQCTGPGDCYGNPNWANIWYADVEFSGQTTLNTVIINDEFMGFAQDVPPVRPIYFDVVAAWRTTPSPNMTISTLSDSSYLTQVTTDFWAGAFIGVHKSPNEVSIRAITGFDPATQKLTFVALNNTAFYNPSPYSIIGHPFNITENSYAVIGTRIWMWAAGSANPNTLAITIGKLPGGLNVDERHYITLDGLKVVGFYGTAYTHGYGVYMNPGNSTHYAGLVIKNCDFKNLRSINQDAVLFLRQLSSCTVTGNTIESCLRSKGMYCIGQNFNIADNRVIRTGGTGIYFAGVTSGRISHNTISGIRGAHGNGISVYLRSDGAIVERNSISECSFPITYENTDNISFFNNFIDCTYGNVNEWSGMTGLIRWINNTFYNSPNHNGLNIDQSSGVGIYEIRNNILDGMLWRLNTVNSSNVTHTHNVWIGHHSGFPAPTLGMGESENTNLSAIFTNHSAGDFTLKSGSPAIGTARNVSLSSGFSNDITGAPRGSIWDIGAYQYTVPPTSGSPQNVRVQVN